MRALRWLALCVAGVVSGATAQPGPPMRSAPVARTAWFTLYSDPLFNAHDRLLWAARAPDSAASLDACLARRPAAERRAWQIAADYYAARLVGRDRSVGTLYAALRYETAGFPGVDVLPDSASAPALAVIQAALPAYLACGWAEDDRRNRAWIAELLPRLARHEDTLRAQVVRIFGAPWPAPITVDVATWIGATGANTFTQPHHIAVSSRDRSYRGDAGLEMLFHEASHTLVDSGDDIIRRALRDTSVTRGLRVPPQLSHVLLFYTVGRLTADRLAATGTSGYVMYLIAEGLYERVWPAYRAPLERHWQPYLEGRTDAAGAIRAVLDAMVPP